MNLITNPVTLLVVDSQNILLARIAFILTETPFPTTKNKRKIIPFN